MIKKGKSKDDILELGYTVEDIFDADEDFLKLVKIKKKRTCIQCVQVLFFVNLNATLNPLSELVQKRVQ